MKRRPLPSFLLGLGLLLLLALFLRLYRIDAQSLWSDEGNSVAMAPRAIADIVQRTAKDIHPPLYYIVLHGWVALVGRSEAAVRALSAIFGVLTVAITAQLGQRLGGPRAALFAAIAAALAPFAIYYSQEARMYMLVTLLAAASWLALSRYLTGKRILPYVFLTLAMLYTHYYAVSVVVAHNLAWLWETVRRRRSDRRWWVQWIVTQAALVALYLPWLWYASESILNWPSISADITLPFIAQEMARIFSVGLATESLPWWSAFGFALLFLAGLYAALRQRAALPLCYVAVPPLLMLLLSLDRPFWNPKFLLLALPGYHLLLGLGAALLLDQAERVEPRLLAPLASGTLLFLAIALREPLQSMYWDPRFWRDDYRSIVRTIQAQAGPEDAVLLDGAGQTEIFDYYYEGTLPRYALPATRPLDEAATIRQLEQMAGSHERLFTLWWAEEEGDPTRLIPRWLDENAFEAGSRWFGNVRLATYRLGELPPPEPLDARFLLSESDTELHLQGISLAPTTVVGGDVIAVNTLWSARDAQSPITFFAQLLDGGNHLMGQYDGSGGAPAVPEWTEGVTQTVRFGLPTAVGTPPGNYTLILGAYRADTGQRLLLPSGDALQVATVRVEAPTVPLPVDALALRHDEARNVRFGEITLVGARANRLGSDHAPETPLAAGEPLALLLHWRAEQDGPEVPALVLRLSDAVGNVRAEWPYEPTEGRYPFSSWKAGELVRDPAIRFLPTLEAGQYRLTLESEQIDVLVGTISVQ